MLNLQEAYREYKERNDTEPKVDLASCLDCGWEGPKHKCDVMVEGDWEGGHCYVDICPECGGPIEYNMTKEQSEKWNAWFSLKYLL